MPSTAMKKLYPAVQELLLDIEQYCARAGVNRTQFGMQAMNDGNFIPRLEHGRIPSLKTIDRVRDYISSKTKAVPSKSSSHRRKLHATP